MNAELGRRLSRAVTEWSAAVHSRVVNGDLAGWYRDLAAAHTQVAEVYEAILDEPCSQLDEVANNGRVAYHYSAARRAELTAEHYARAVQVLS